MFVCRLFCMFFRLIGRFSQYCRKCAISFADEKFEAMVIFTARFATRRCRIYRNGLHSLNIALGVIVATLGQHCRLNAGWFEFCFESLWELLGPGASGCITAFWSDKIEVFLRRLWELVTTRWRQCFRTNNLDDFLAVLERWSFFFGHISHRNCAMHLLFSTGARNARPTRITGFDLIQLDLICLRRRYAMISVYPLPKSICRVTLFPFSLWHHPYVLQKSNNMSLFSHHLGSPFASVFSQERSVTLRMTITNEWGL